MHVIQLRPQEHKDMHIVLSTLSSIAPQDLKIPHYIAKGVNKKEKAEQKKQKIERERGGGGPQMKRF